MKITYFYVFFVYYGRDWDLNKQFHHAIQPASKEKEFYEENLRNQYWWLAVLGFNVAE